MSRRPKKNRPTDRQSGSRASCPPDAVETAALQNNAAETAALQDRERSFGRPYTTLAVCGFLLLAVALVFGQTVQHDFVNLDDSEYVYENTRVLGGLTRDSFVWALVSSHSANWHPLTWISHILDGQMYGANPGGHHLTSVILHAAAAMLLFLALLRMTGDLWPSAAAAAIFAVHPQHVESVAWVTERKDVLSGLLFMATLWTYQYYAARPASWGRYATVVLCFALGLTAKPMLVTLPFVLLLLDYWPLRRMSEGLLSLVIEKIPLFALSAASCAATIWAQVQVAAFKPAEHVHWGWLAGNAVVSYVAYLIQTFYPAGLAAYYTHLGINLPIWKVVVAMLLLLAISAACIAWARKLPYLIVGWLWYLGMLVPVIGLVQVGAQGRADRYMYLPQIGIALIAAWGAADLANRWRWRPLVRAAAAGAIIALLAGCAWRQTSYWRNSMALWSHALECTSNNHFAHNSMGAVLDKEDRMDEAIEHYRQAIEICPGYVTARNNLGVNLYKKKKFDEAALHCRIAVEVDPQHAEAYGNLGVILHAQGKVDEAIKHFQKALDIDANYAMAHNNLGAVLVKQGRPDEAVAHYRKTLEIEPDYAEAYYNLGVVLAGRGQVDEAIAHYRKALEIKPDYADAHNNLANALARRGRFDEAMDYYRKALKIKPDHAEVRYNFANVLTACKRLEEAVFQYRKGLEIKPNDAKIRNNLGNALANQGRIDEAIAQYRKVLEIEPGHAGAHRNLEIVLSGRGRILNALAQRRESLRLNPNDVALLNDTAWILATDPNALFRNGAEAVELAQRATRLSGGREPAILGTLAAAYAEAGRFPEAVQTARKALELAARQNKQALVESIKAKIQLYEAETPFREK